MRTHNICIYKKVNKKYTGCNLKTTEFHECALIGVCAVIRLNTVYINDRPIITSCQILPEMATYGVLVSWSFLLFFISM